MDAITWFNQIVENCDKLKAEETITVTEFGVNKDLTLHIRKDSDYNPETDVDSWNLVFITTKQNGKAVDDTGDVYVTDGSLYRELKRIFNYENFKTV